MSSDFRLPGRGWLEFQVTPLDAGRRSRIRQIATFDPRGVLGRLYWYAVYPFHAVVFGGLLRELARLATATKRKRPVPLAEHRPVEPENDGPGGPSPAHVRTSRG